MMEDELIQIWQSSSDQERIKFEKSRLMIELESSLTRLHKWWKYLELVEGVSILICIPVFAFYVYFVPFILSKIASALTVIWLIYVIVRIVRIKKYKPSAFTESYLDYLHKTRKYLKVQMYLLKSSLYWYILPGIFFIFLFLVGAWEKPETHNVIILTAVLAICIGVITYYINKRRVRKEFEPRLKKIDELIAVMEE
ncbi:hypothetical protein [Flagellimonas onchidii]|uniref:hypothetical protein n=1 Tax=Flagellimonas onchidii TaxID=2562684 RepID=UPI0010A609A9|nr:hypothetical protein [Allomuricauda onchidii]